MVDFVMIPGLNNSGPGHWQTLWEPLLGADRIVQRDWSRPSVDHWADAVTQHLEARRRPSVLIAHSLGCLAVASAWPRIKDCARAVLFVAPANPYHFSPRPPVHRIGVPSSLLASRNDRWLAFEKAQNLARLWGSDLVDMGSVGHINVDSGHGHWPDGWRQLGDLLKRSELNGLSTRFDDTDHTPCLAGCG
jgi:predicted alpha/beta hydrolase family esterase